MSVESHRASEAVRRRNTTRIDAAIARRSGQLACLWIYIFNVADIEHHQALRVVLQREIGPEAKDIIMTIAEQFRQEGREQGERRALLRLLRKRFGAQVNDDTERRVAAAAPERITLWLDGVLSAATLGELLAD